MKWGRKGQMGGIVGPTRVQYQEDQRGEVLNADAHQEVENIMQEKKKKKKKIFHVAGLEWVQMEARRMWNKDWGRAHRGDLRA
ncbi:hypothetical protein OOK27_40790 [Streptomyces canus]|uniref:hypothetical protein n=1 Tax=Streptomyces canus TaxID=58343 RepID=UPI00225529BE|nr:hypothetical protein [Streptomyces canus]MCX5260415.1 hypothetical protein [Streptomyces canus]